MTTATRNTPSAISAFCEISPPQDALTALSLIGLHARLAVAADRAQILEQAPA